MKTIKKVLVLNPEAYHLKKYKTYDKLMTDIDRYIHFYNTQRYQAKLNKLTPLEFRTQKYDKALLKVNLLNIYHKLIYYR
ncbi:TPA: IS3 family transposase [Streptococcus pneumoniae]|nr:IS3 family transposase [Streptococcus pneumoniae]HEU3701994.1 IS3 family transposase [Streptococcus pneumoniae]